MKRIAVAFVLGILVLVTRSDAPASAILSEDFRWLQSSTSGRGSMLDFSSKMVCSGSGYNSISYAAGVWDANVFGGNGFVPFYLWNSTSCNQLMDNSVPVNWKDQSFACYSYPGDCTFGVSYNFGFWDDPPQGGGSYGVCWGSADLFCTISDKADVKISTNSKAQMTSTNLLTRKVAIHELGHPVGLGDQDWSWTCDLQYRSIMNYDCLQYHDQVNPGPQDQVEIAALY